jgi:hypothetical protein
MMIQTMCHQVDRRLRGYFRYGLAPLALFLLVSSAGRNTLGQARNTPGVNIDLDFVHFKDWYALETEGVVPQADEGIHWARLTVLALIASVILSGGGTLLAKAFRKRESDPHLNYIQPHRLNAPSPGQPVNQEVSSVRKISAQLQPIIQAMKDSSQKVNALEKQIFDLRVGLHSLPDSLTGEWKKTIGNIRDLQEIPGVTPRAGSQKLDGSHLGREELVLLAVVNQWISSGAKKRQDMLAMAGKLGLEVQLVEQKDPAKVLSDVMGIGMVDFSESVTDGGWLYCTGPDGMGFAAPADSNLFKEEPDRMLLQRMFDNVDVYPEPLRFAKVYRACRLRMKQPPHRYEIVHKGLLQLAGLPSPRELPPPDFDSLLHPTQGSPTSPPTLIFVVREQMMALAMDLATLQNGLKLLREDLRDLKAPVLASRIVDLDKSIQRVVQGELRQVEDRLAQRFSPPPPSPPPPPGLTFTQMKSLRKEITDTKSFVGILTDRISMLEEKVGLKLFRTQRNVEARAELLPPQPSARLAVPSATPSPAPTAPPPATLQVEIPASPRMALAAPRAELPAAKRQGLPEAWLRVIASLGAIRGLDEKALAEGLERLKTALQKLPGAANIRLVHLKESMGKFQVHDAVATPERQITCRVCDDTKTFQAAVCAGEEGAATLHVLLPPGDYAPYNYTAGYYKLIQNMPNQQFQIQTVVSPTVLTIVPGSSPTEYEVQYKLQWG